MHIAQSSTIRENAYLQWSLSKVHWYVEKGIIHLVPTPNLPKSEHLPPVMFFYVCVSRFKNFSFSENLIHVLSTSFQVLVQSFSLSV